MKAHIQSSNVMDNKYDLCRTVISPTVTPYRSGVCIQIAFADDSSCRSDAETLRFDSMLRIDMRKS